MPELPEVETVARSLDSLVSGRTIAKAELRRERLAPAHTPDVFSVLLSGRRINGVTRRGKHILFDLSEGQTLIVHLRMSGRFSLLGPDDADPKFTHAVFYLDDTDERLVFDDQRHFGFMRVVPTDELLTTKELVKLAPEPFSNEFSVEYFHTILKRSKRSLKEVLIDQTKVTGVGNIYASEALFIAGIHPAMRSERLSRPRAIRLREAVIAVLQAAVNHASGRTMDPKDLEGNYFSAGDDRDWNVYDREGEACRNCNSAIVRLKQGGRSTYFCRKCQRR